MIFTVYRLLWVDGWMDGRMDSVFCIAFQSTGMNINIQCNVQ